MILDARSVAILLALICALIGGALLSVTRGYLREIRGASTWAWATLLQAPGWLSFGLLRDATSDWASIVVGQLLIQYSLLLYLSALHQFLGLPFRARWFQLLLVVQSVGLFWTSVIVPDYQVRQVIVASTKMIILFMSAAVLLRHPTVVRRSHQFTAALFALSGVLTTLRAAIFVFWGHLANEQPLEQHWLVQVTYLSYFVFEVSVTFGFVLMCNERYLDGRREAEDRFRRASQIDPLTELPNRAMITERLKELVAQVERRPGELYAVLFVDVDNFKQVNDSFGHDVGDGLLVEIGRRLADVTRSGDGLERGRSGMAGRFGGDEFVLVLDRIREPGGAVRVAERVLATMSRPFRVSGRLLNVRCSIGVSTSVRDYDSMDTLIRDADLAMYRAKTTGRATYVVFDESMRQTEEQPAPVFSAHGRRFRVG